MTVINLQQQDDDEKEKENLKSFPWTRRVLNRCKQSCSVLHSSLKDTIFWSPKNYPYAQSRVEFDSSGRAQRVWFIFVLTLDLLWIINYFKRR